MAKKWIGDCAFEITPATKKWAATWFVTRGERQKDGIADTTIRARQAAREAAVTLGCKLPKRRPRRAGVRSRLI